MNKKLIAIGIPTFKRPKGLKRLLDTLALQKCDFNLQVIVADNDSEYCEGLNLVNEIAKEFLFSIEAIVVSERGISSVRNALMKQAFENHKADMLAMVDDDETVEPKWIFSLVQTLETGNYDVVGGAVYPEFEFEPPCWTNGLNLYWRRIHDEGKVELISGSGNILISKSIWNNYPGQLFDVEFGLTGGEDKEYFTRLKKYGATFGFSPKAVSHEFIGGSRMTLAWAEERAYRIGSADIRIKLKLSDNRFSELAKALFTVSVCTALWLLLFGTKKREWIKFKLERQKGKLNGLIGKPPEVYKQTHGS
ncbi:glycosyltransferase [Colwellia sp. MSW7]|uniref:Glycosyltransferase n=1 Tax=Colwellia maritima TaxID=2912588 RepID=A0ABS9X7L0_9GAMM|nr:glycosyltransferase [Colwellia maritima]MCI2285476.1 glycosyltransferase [Colwellia maritima]